MIIDVERHTKEELQIKINKILDELSLLKAQNKNLLTKLKYYKRRK